MWPQLRLNGIWSLPVGSSIKLHTLSGGDIDEASCGLPKEVTSKPWDDAMTLTEKWVAALTHKVQVPDDCISFQWSCDDHKKYRVLVVFIALSAKRHSELLEDNPTAPCMFAVCKVCAQPRGDAEFIDVRAHTCSRCEPDYLCYRCKVTVRGGGVRCYSCLTKEEFVQAKEDYPESLRFRMSLLTRIGD